MGLYPGEAVDFGESDEIEWDGEPFQKSDALLAKLRKKLTKA